MSVMFITILLQMILTNALCALSQALDLRWLETRVKTRTLEIIHHYGIHIPCLMPGSTPSDAGDFYRYIPWYDVAFCPRRVAHAILDMRVLPTNGVNKEAFIAELVDEMETLMVDITAGKHTDDVAATLGNGKRMHRTNSFSHILLKATVLNFSLFPVAYIFSAISKQHIDENMN